MKIYLCSKCNKKIPREEVLAHRQFCGPDSNIGLKEGMGKKLKHFLRIFFIPLLITLLIIIAYWLGMSSFQSLASMRRLERVPAVEINSVLPGEAQLNGQAMPAERTLRAPRSNTTCIYYRYKVERRRRDSEGRTRWTTITDRDAFVPFILKDESGEILINPNDEVDFRVRSSYRTRRGDRRYTEYRIDPGDQVFVFGYAAQNSQGMEVCFDREGDYDAIVSEYGQAEERSRQGLFSLLKTWGGLVLMAIALSMTLRLLRIHRVLVHFSFLTIMMVVYLVFFGLQMMKTDLHAAAARLERHEKAVRTELNSEFNDTGFQWDGQWASLPSFTNEYFTGVSQDRLERWRDLRLNLARAEKRVRVQRSTFPERWLAPVWRVPRFDPIPLPETDQVRLQEEKTELPPALTFKIQSAAIAAGLIIAVLGFVFGFRRIRFKRCIENLPTTPTAGAAYGLAEFKGLVELPENGEPLKGPLSHLPCVQYHYTVREKQGSGKNASWKTIIDQTLSRPFFCRDAEGKLLVDPLGARIYTVHSNYRTAGRIRYSETRLEPADPLYAIGECALEPIRGTSLYLNQPADRYPFILSNLTENQVMLKIAGAGMTLLNLSFAGILLAALLFLGLTGTFGPADFLAASLIAPIFMLLVTVTLHYNDLVFLRERMRRNRSNIEVSLNKRRDLVPLLEKTTRAFMVHEQSIQKELTTLRKLYGQPTPSEPEAVGSFMETENAALGKLIASVERYPELKSHRMTAELMHSLVVLENEIAFMRNGYNDAAARYNTRIQSFPDMLLAGVFQFREASFIHAETKLMRMPPDLQAEWEKNQIATENAAIENVNQKEEASKEEASKEEEKTSVTNEEHGSTSAMLASATVPERVSWTETDSTDSAVEARVQIYALLINDQPAVRDAQLESIAVEETPEIRKKTEVAARNLSAETSEAARLIQAEEGYEAIRSMSPDGYRAFHRLVNSLMEADQVISLFQYALQKSMDRYLEPGFGGVASRPSRHRNYQHILKEISIILSRLARAEAEPEENAEEAFAAGVADLNHQPDSDFTLLPTQQCTLAAFDEALEEVAHATHMIRANLFYACQSAVKANREYTMDQAMLLAALADTLGYKRPAWAGL